MTRVATTTLDAPPKELLSPPAKDRGGVQSIERAFAILEEVARHREGIRLGDLSRRVGLHTSTTFHLAKTMVSLGYLSHVRANKTFRIGRPLFTLAASAFDEVELVAIATPILQSLSAETEESSHFTVRSGDDVVMLARVAGSGAFQLADRVGAVRPAHCTALGKILLAALDEVELRAYLARRPPQAFTLKTVIDVDQIVREIEVVRRDGIAYDDSEYNAEARCVAVAIRDFTGTVKGAIGISGPVWRLSLQALQEKSRLVRNAAERMSREFGFMPPGALETAAPSPLVRTREVQIRTK